MYLWDHIIGENIYLSDVESKVIKLHAFQRMKSIKQTGFVYVEFPGAVHTRYDHSIGTTYWADSIYKAILGDPDDDQLKALRLAALLHDIGHGPFSHALDMLLHRNPDWAPVVKNYEVRSATITTNGESRLKSHEQLTLEFIATSSSLREIVDKQLLVNAFRILNHQHRLSNIISGDLDADRIDYLVRDSYYSGFPFGRDIAHLFKQLIQNNLKYEIKEGDENEELLTIGEEGVSALETFLIARFHSYMHIYYSPKTRAANLEFVKALEDALCGLDDPKEAVYAIYKHLDDNDLLLCDFRRIPDAKLQVALERRFSTLKPLLGRLLTGRILTNFSSRRFITMQKQMVFNLIRAHRSKKLRTVEHEVGRHAYFDVFFPSSLATDVHVSIKGCSKDYSPLFVYDYSFLIRGLEQDMFMNSGIIVCSETRDGLHDFLPRLVRVDFEEVLKKPCDLDVILYGLKHYLSIVQNSRRGPPWLAKRRGIYSVLKGLAEKGLLKGYKFPKYYHSPRAYEALQILEFLGVIREQFVLVFAQANRGFIPSYQYSIDNEAYKELEPIVLLTDKEKRSIEEIVSSVAKEFCLYC
jgi:HD superfamily phosphohydrolase